jgi:hypothetical protein
MSGAAPDLIAGYLEELRAGLRVPAAEEPDHIGVWPDQRSWTARSWYAGHVGAFRSRCHAWCSSLGEAASGAPAHQAQHTM